MKTLLKRGIVLTVFLAATSLTQAGINGTWIKNGTGQWDNPLNWLGGVVADGKDGTAHFTTPLTGDGDVELASDRTIGHMVFSDTEGDGEDEWRVDPVAGGSQWLKLSVTGPLPPTITVNNPLVRMWSELKGEVGFTKLGDGILVLCHIDFC